MQPASGPAEAGGRSPRTSPGRKALPDAVAGETLRVRGLVQGVGFRPTVWRLAHECDIAGDVCNDAEGVLIHAWGQSSARRHFVQRLRDEAPPLSRIDALESAPLDGACPTSGFAIVASAGGRVQTAVVADASTCADCLAEVRDPVNRRFGYAFTNCTHCGPRLSIVRRIPYDRAYTSMAAFTMCAACRAEYENPADRRFHAQPNACANCGPRLWLESAGDSHLDITGDPIEATQRLLRSGHVVAIKGIGGIHLACDAANAEAVKRLRQRKRREHKPFALMARDVAMIRRYCALGEAQEKVLRATAAPIVLILAEGAESVAADVAPGQRTLGIMLPYTPLHHLLMEGLEAPIVLTSGNRSEEPQCIDNAEARERLVDIADAFLLHDRDIVNRLDDSVVRVIAGEPALLRRARGYAPAPLRLPASFAVAPPVLAFGGELKNTICLLRDGEAIVSQHLGDLENPAAQTAFRQTLDLYLAMYEHTPEIVAIDRHPDYLPAKFGREWAARQDRSVVVIQHHHAHIAACLADNGVELDAPPVLGIALDGLGFGDDNTLWGGELLLADYRQCRRLGALSAVPMPGAAQAIHQPWRMAFAHLQRLGDWPQLQADHAALPFFRSLADQPLPTLRRMMGAEFNSPLTSSVGRLFDAVSAVVDLRQTVSYEGQGAIELEAAVDPAALDDGQAYPFAIDDDDGLARLEPRPMWLELLQDMRCHVATAVIAARFHAGLADGLARMVDHLAARHHDVWHGRIALSGGVFQNAVLSERLIGQLESRGLSVLRHARVPSNDGGLSLGQATIAAARAIARPLSEPVPVEAMSTTSGGIHPCA